MQKNFNVANPEILTTLEAINNGLLKIWNFGLKEFFQLFKEEI
jgi:hypothetical protein